MARTYIISEICGDWALQIREPGHPHQFLYFNSENNADLVKSILEWEDAHPNEAVPYTPTLTPPNEPLKWKDFSKLIAQPVYIRVFGGEEYWALVVSVDKHTAYFARVGKVIDEGNKSLYGNKWIAYRRPPEGEEDT